MEPNLNMANSLWAWITEYPGWFALGLIAMDQLSNRGFDVTIDRPQGGGRSQARTFRPCPWRKP